MYNKNFYFTPEPCDGGGCGGGGCCIAAPAAATSCEGSTDTGDREDGDQGLAL